MKNIFVSAASIMLAMFAFVSDGYSAEEKLLIKVGDIKPVKNAQGEIQSCNFEVVAYNRSEADIKGASIEIVWSDSTIASVVSSELAKGEQKTRDADKVVMMLDIPEIKSFKQVSMRTSLNTDRCFLLLDEATINVRRCSASVNRTQSPADAKNAPVRTPNVNVSCAPFEFVASKNPQYYREFKKLSTEEQKKLEKTKLEKDIDDINDNFDKVIHSVEETSGILKSIGNGK